MAVYEYDSQNDELKRIAGGTLFSEMAIGTFVPFGGSSVPTGFLLCDGSAVSRTTYADLFKVIGTAFGSGDGSTTFNIPDMREAVPKGAGLTGLSNNHLDADGLAVGEFIDDRIQNHKHGAFVQGTGGSKWKALTGGDSDDWGGMDNSVEGARTGDTTEVKSVGCNWIIKALSVGVPADFVSAVKKECCLYPDYSSPIAVGGSGVSVTSWTATVDCFANFTYWSSGTTPINLRINNNTVSTYDIYNGAISQFSGYIKKGDIVSFSNDANINRPEILRIFALRS